MRAQESRLGKVKNLLRTSVLDSPPGDWRRRLRSNRERKSWERAGRPLPPPHVIKEDIVAAYAVHSKIETMIETGTYLGDMVYAMSSHFRRIVSIELSERFYEQARRRFRTFQNVEILLGDSGEEIARVLEDISSPCLFWLDGHYSAGTTARGSTDTPIVEELKTIFKHRVKDHVILIDDARCFDGTHDYPTIANIKALIGEHANDYELSVESDVIRIQPSTRRFANAQSLS